MLPLELILLLRVLLHQLLKQELVLVLGHVRHHVARLLQELRLVLLELLVALERVVLNVAGVVERLGLWLAGRLARLRERRSQVAVGLVVVKAVDLVVELLKDFPVLSLVLVLRHEVEHREEGLHCEHAVRSRLVHCAFPRHAEVICDFAKAAVLINFESYKGFYV